MKKCYLFIFVYSFCISAFAQIDSSGTVSFINHNKKLIFIELQPSIYNKPKSKIKIQSSLAAGETAHFLSENFSCFRVIIGDNSKMTSFLIRKGKSNILPKYYVFDSDSNLLSSDFGSRKKLKDFVALRDSAIKMAEKFENLKRYATKFADNALSKIEIKDFIEYKLAVKKYDNAALIERFAALMTEKDKTNPETVLLILRSGPYFRGLAYDNARTDTALYHKIYKAQSNNHSLNFFQRAFKNSLDYATENKDLKMAQTAAQFLQYQYHRSKYAQEIYNPRVMMNYYKSVKDTSKFLSHIGKSYDDYLAITPDSSQKYEAKMLQKRRSETMAGELGELKIVTIASKDYFANQLNYAAIQILYSKTNDPAYLNKGINYCRHALLLSPSYYRAKVALAQLLYRSGFYSEAEKMQKEAINTSGVPPSSKILYTADLEKIINRNME